MNRRLRIGVPESLFALAPVGGHGKVWRRVLAELRGSATVIAIDRDGRPRARAARAAPSVVLASGHDDLPRVTVPLVVQVHEAGWFDPVLRTTLNPAFLERIAPYTERAVHAAARVIAPSAAARRDLIAAYGLEPERVFAVHHGVDSTFHPRAAGGRALVARHAGGRDTPYVLYAATLHPRKNLRALCEAFAELSRAGLPHVLAIAGHPAPDRPDSSELLRAAIAPLEGAADRVVLLGEPSDEQLAALMAGADAFCLPSLYEGFGLTALEAMACGTPVVVSDRGALPEVVGEAGVVVEPSAAAVRDGLRKVLVDRAAAKQLGAAGVRRARDFTWERAAEGWLAVLQEVATASYTHRR